MPCDRYSSCDNSESMRSPVNECGIQQGNSVFRASVQTSSQNQRQCNSDDSSVSSEQSTLQIGNESPRSSPQLAPRYSHRKDIPKPENANRDPSPMPSSKSDPEQQDTVSWLSDLTQPPELNRSISHESNKDRKESLSSDRAKKKSSWHNIFYSTYKTRCEQFKRYFKELPFDERLIGDYSCALQREILYQGRLFVTQNYVCFYANFFRWEKCIFVRWKDVSSVTKGKTAKLIPNAILISTNSEKLFFTTFAARDKAFMMLFRVWQNALLGQTMTNQELYQWVHTTYGDELDLTSEDEDCNCIPPATSFDDKIYPIVGLPDSLSETQVFGGGTVDKGGSELELSATDSANKNQGSVPPQNAFVEVSTPSPSLIELDSMPTGFTDNSSESDANAGEEVPATCSSPHSGQEIVNMVLPIHVDTLFTQMFTNSKFFLEFNTMRKSTEINASPWQQSPDSEKKIRTISMVVSLNQAIGPKSATVKQTQVMLPCSVSGRLYSIDDEIVNKGIPYEDSFYIVMHYCLEKKSKNETNLKIYGDLKFRKSVWGVVRGLIEKATWANMKDHNECLVKALLEECGETIPKQKNRRKGRWRHRATLPMDHLPSSSFRKVSRTTDTDGRSRKFIKLSRTTEPDGRGRALSTVGGTTDAGRRCDILLYFLLAVIIILVFSNFLLYYKLRELEVSTGWGKRNLDQSEVDILKNPLLLREELLKITRIQESIHSMGVDKWQEALQSSVDLLKKAEEAFHTLQDTMRAPCKEALFGKDKQEL